MRKLSYIFIAVLFVFTLTHAEDKERNRGLKKATVSWAKHVKQRSGEFFVWLSNQMVMGVEAWDGSPPNDDCPGSNGIGAGFPESACVEHLYGAGPWIGGIQNGVRKVTEGYNGNSGFGYFLPEQKDTARDKIWMTSVADTNYYNSSVKGYYRKGMSKRDYDDDGDGRVDEDELDGFDNDGDWVRATDDLGADGLPDTLETGCKGGYDPATNTDPAFDNYDGAGNTRDLCVVEHSTGQFRKKNNRDLYTQGNGVPDHGEPHVDEDYFAYSDNDLYMTATDTFRNPTYANHQKMKVKVWQRSYAWNKRDLYNIIVNEYLFINVGRDPVRDIVRDVYVGFFADMDVGPVSSSSFASDNYAGYLDSLRTAYIHNPNAAAATPMGLTVLQTPRPLDSLKYVFQWHDFDPPCGGTEDSALYSCMSCEAFGDSNCIKPDQSKTSLHDTRFIFSFGKFDYFKPGDTLKIAVALVVGEGVSGSDKSLAKSAEQAIKLWSKDYYTAKVPPSPCLDTTVGFKKVTLRWGRLGASSNCTIDPYETWDDSNKLAESYPDTSWRRINPPIGHDRGGRIFEGYRVYRSESEEFDRNSFTLLKQFDIAGDDFEYNTGLDTFFVDTNLFRGKTYWYSVTSFGIPDLTFLQVPGPNGTVVIDSLYSANSESDLSENAIKVTLPFSVSEQLGEVLVVPNPYRVDQSYTQENGGWEGRTANWDENRRMLKFIHLPRKCTIRVFTLAGDLVTTLNHDAGDEDRGEYSWNILSESNRALASGIYVFTVESDYGRQVGKFVLIR